MGDKIYLLNNGKSLLSCYSNHETLILASLKSETVEKLKHINSYLYSKSGILLNDCISHETPNTNRHILKIAPKNQCELEKKNHNFDVTYLDTASNDDLMFITSMFHLSNSKLFIIDEMQYFDKLPILSIQGFIIDCGDMDFEYRDFLNALFEL